jgi:hypothetical protein
VGPAQHGYAIRKVGVQLARKKLASIRSIPYLCPRISITDQNRLKRMIKKTVLFSILLFFGVMIIISFNSCLIRKRDHIYHFTPHDSLYFNSYDTLCYYTFRTNNGLDSLWIKRKVCIDNYKEWYVDIAPREGELDPVFYYVGEFIHNGCKDSLKVYYKKIYENSDPELKVVLGERYAWPVDDPRNMKSEGIYKDTIIIDDENSQVNHCFDHCYEFEYLIWHKYKGIIGYKLSDGTIYSEQGDLDK